MLMCACNLVSYNKTPEEGTPPKIWDKLVDLFCFVSNCFYIYICLFICQGTLRLLQSYNKNYVMQICYREDFSIMNHSDRDRVKKINIDILTALTFGAIFFLKSFDLDIKNFI